MAHEDNELLRLLPDRRRFGRRPQPDRRALGRHRSANRHLRNAARAKRRSDHLDGDLRSGHSCRDLPARPRPARAGARRRRTDRRTGGVTSKSSRRCRRGRRDVGSRSRDDRNDRLAMCLALIAFAAHPRYNVVVAANRDEYHARPAAPAAWWDEGFLAGRDLKAGGTWLGVDTRGRFALLTNVREPSRHDPARTVTRDVRAEPAYREHAALGCAPRASPCRGPPQRLQSDRRRYRRAPVGLEPLAIALVNRARPRDLRRFESPAGHAVAQGRCARSRRFVVGAKAMRAPTIRPPSLRSCATRSGRPTRRLPATGVTLERERMLSLAFHHQRGLRHAVLDGADDRSRGQRAPGRAHVRSGGNRRRRGRVPFLTADAHAVRLARADRSR